jgi:hypothetical protein
MNKGDPAFSLLFELAISGLPIRKNILRLQRQQKSVVFHLDAPLPLFFAEKYFLSIIQYDKQCLSSFLRKAGPKCKDDRLKGS